MIDQGPSNFLTVLNSTGCTLYVPLKSDTFFETYLYVVSSILQKGQCCGFLVVGRSWYYFLQRLKTISQVSSSVSKEVKDWLAEENLYDNSSLNNCFINVYGIFYKVCLGIV